jgi:cytochrome P450
VRGALCAALQEQVETRRRKASGGDDVLSILIAPQSAAGDHLSDEEIQDQLITMILAGHETTASSITWALVCLNAQPNAMSRLERELDQAGASLPDERLAGLPYLQAVCLETLRMRPVIPVVARELQLPFRIRGMTLPAGTFVTPCSYLAHRRPEAFPDPDTFKPERFLDQRYSPYEYFPFGGGVHRCIGMSFALLELQLVLGVLVRTFRFSACGPIRPVRRAVTIVASGGGKMHVERRQP